MYCSLTEMLASSHRDELHRRASQHNVARQARQSRRAAAARNTVGTSPTRFLNLQFARRPNQIRPAAAA